MMNLLKDNLFNEIPVKTINDAEIVSDITLIYLEILVARNWI